MYTTANYYEDAIKDGTCDISDVEDAAVDVFYDDEAPLVETVYMFVDGSTLRQVHGEYWAD